MVEFVIKTKLASASNDVMGSSVRKGKTHHIFSVNQEFGPFSKYFDSHRFKPYTQASFGNEGPLYLPPHLPPPSSYC